ncbi:ATP-binding protein [Mesorhizobium qingshengii]|uniref:ATP-binding protein n=1 Tax=Mesorhizobium qingshengii TaxID=1165689 RepID=A0ABT4QYE1_9HYPH|nr:hypothetical protein [Mesorhizobium qingshengii]MCZ8546603.1 ATP-binding protein [Mesorhizobium qingshengii]
MSKLTDGTANAQAELMRAARELRQSFDTTKLKELEPPLKLIMDEATALGLPVGKVIRALLDSGSVTFNAGTISLHDEIGVPLRSLGVGSSRLLIAALQRRVSTSTMTFLIDELEYGLEPHRIIRPLPTSPRSLALALGEENFHSGATQNERRTEALRPGRHSKRPHRLNAIFLFELTQHHFERCLKSTLIKHHRFFCFVKVTPVGEGILVLIQYVTNAVVDVEIGIVRDH